ncbi:unnamed protein product, partial [Ectocarpus sp. 13 AM-2016]
AYSYFACLGASRRGRGKGTYSCCACHGGETNDKASSRRRSIIPARPITNDGQLFLSTLPHLAQTRFCLPVRGGMGGTGESLAPKTERGGRTGVAPTTNHDKNMVR